MLAMWWFAMGYWARLFWNRIRGVDTCECCAAEANHRDVDGVPLCDECWDVLHEESA